MIGLMFGIVIPCVLFGRGEAMSMWFRGCKKSDLDGLFGCDRPRPRPRIMRTRLFIYNCHMPRLTRRNVSAIVNRLRLM